MIKKGLQAVYFSPTVEEVLAFILIFSFGILHGANDLEILRRRNTASTARNNSVKLLVVYAGFVLGSALLFSLFPLAALIFFIVFSGYHFGEQHWVGRMGRRHWLQKLLYTSYGLTILFLLFASHGAQVAEVMQEITGYRFPQDWFTYGCLGFSGLFLITCFLNFYWRQMIRYLVRELFLLIVFFIVFNTASLIWAFAIYFVVWHSIPSLVDQIRLLYGSVNWRNGSRYVRSSAIYWAGALATLAIAFLYFRGSSYGFMPLFFSFLAAITFPHVLVISRLYKS
ncbi:MAG: Brp/Blh family beta-carotene 15,15'-dioxygenase [Robiginitalea sp.]